MSSREGTDLRRDAHGVVVASRGPNRFAQAQYHHHATPEMKRKEKEGHGKKRSEEKTRVREEREQERRGEERREEKNAHRQSTGKLHLDNVDATTVQGVQGGFLTIQWPKWK